MTTFDERGRPVSDALDRLIATNNARAAQLDAEWQREKARAAAMRAAALALDPNDLPGLEITMGDDSVKMFTACRYRTGWGDELIVWNTRTGETLATLLDWQRVHITPAPSAAPPAELDPPHRGTVDGMVVHQLDAGHRITIG